MMFTLFWGVIILMVATAILFIVGLGFIIYGVIAHCRKRKMAPDNLTEQYVPYAYNQPIPKRKKSPTEVIIIGVALCLPLICSVPSMIIDEIKKAPAKQTIMYHLEHDDYEKAALLLEQGADPNKDNPLTYVCYWGEKQDEQMAELLLEHGADPNLADVHGELPLLRAILYAENETIVRLLLEYGADPNKSGSYGATPLWTANHVGNEAIIQLLLEYGANEEEEITIISTPTIPLRTTLQHPFY